MVCFMVFVVVAKVPTLGKDMKIRSSSLDDFVALFLCDAWRLGQDHGEPNLMSL